MQQIITHYNLLQTFNTSTTNGNFGSKRGQPKGEELFTEIHAVMNPAVAI